MSEKVLSIFIDESGDFGKFEKHCPFYLVTMVLHNQSYDISDFVVKFDEHLSNANFPIHAIHSGPLIRREKEYSDIERDRRHYLFNSLFHFARKLDINYLCIRLKKSPDDDKIRFTTKLSKIIAEKIRENTSLWNSFDKIIIYYDNGQTELTGILTAVFNALLNHVDIRKVKPIDYKLFQIADMICTLELLAFKIENGLNFSKSEHDFFINPHDFKKNYLKYIEKKEI